MTGKLLLKHLFFGVLTIVLAWCTFHGLLGWSVSLPTPDFMQQHYKKIGGVDQVYEFTFLFVTWYLPYALIAGVFTFIASRFIPPWVVPVGYSVILFCLRGLNYGFWNWLAMLVLVGLITLGLSALLVYRNRANKVT